MRYALIFMSAAALQSPLDAFDRILVALKQGSEAERRHDTRAAADAGRTVAILGAVPSGDTPDMAQRWSADGTRLTGAPSPYRDRALGPGYRLVSLDPGGFAQFDQTFLAGRRARVAVVALDRAGFDLAVRDEDGPVCAVDARPGGCNWIPWATARFRIEIKNRATSRANFYLVVQ